MKQGARGALVALGLMASAIAACVEEGVPTASASAAVDAPIIASVDARDEGNGIVTLSVKATDPTRSSLRFAWTVDAGTLAAANGQMVQWKVPKAAGTYTASVDVTNSAGSITTGTAQFRVAADGSTTQAGSVQVASRRANASSNGAFNIPSPLGSRAPGANVVNGNPTASQPSPTPTPSPLTQPVATPALPRPNPTPGATPVPIATPTPTPIPSQPVPSPLPTPRPPTPQPQASVPPQVLWRAYDPTKIPTRANLTALHFTSENRGWFVGGNGTVLLYNKTDPNVEPALVFANRLLDTNAILTRVHFASETVGFVTTSDGSVWRTLDAGQTWEESQVPDAAYLSSLVVVNGAEVLVGDGLGQVFRTQNASTPVATDIVWTKQDTKPAARPGDMAVFLKAGASFPTDPTLSYWVGDGIYRLDADAPSVDDRWKRVYRPLGTNERAGVPGDGVITAITMLAQNDIYAGTETGNLLRSQDGGANWTVLGNNKFLNSQQNGDVFGFYLNPLSAIMAITVLDQNNWILGGSQVYDSTNGGAAWRRAPQAQYFGVQDLQMFFSVSNNVAEIRGFALSGSGAGIFQYRPK